MNDNINSVEYLQLRVVHNSTGDRPSELLSQDNTLCFTKVVMERDFLKMSIQQDEKSDSIPPHHSHDGNDHFRIVLQSILSK